jgi:tetratricopeptide (TPR) repeat protein
MKNLITLTYLLLVVGCARDNPQEITSVLDYEEYLTATMTPSKDEALNELVFWKLRLTKDSLSTIALSKIAGLYTSLYTIRGDISDLYTAEKIIKKALRLSARNKDTYLRSLAHNYITQHRFKEAKVLLDSAYEFPDNKRATEFMLFDVSMELGDYRKADEVLGKIKNNADHNYLIRLSKWSDHKGNLDAAIRYMEQAKNIAESGGVESLKVWTYSNIADFYSHAGRLKDAYEHYLMTLELQPDNAYAKKSIAWIVYASEKNSAEATRILDAISTYHKVPDYYLLKAELAEFDENHSEVKAQEENFIKALATKDYGDMYNAYLIELYAKTKPEYALSLAKLEVENRATPEAYQLLAYAQLMAGKSDKALMTIKSYVTGQTFEPKAIYISALVYKANGMVDRLPGLKAELNEAAFELGPVIMREIEKL